MRRQLPPAFLDHIRPLLGGDGEAFIEAMHEKAWRGVRLQRWTTSPHIEQNAKVSAPTDSPLSVSSPLQPARDELACVHRGRPVSWYPEAFYLPPDSRLGKTIWHELGAVYIQEPSAMAAVAALDPQPGEKILDLCAAPGSKATAIGRAMKGMGAFVCNEIHPTRVHTLAQNLERAGIPSLVVNAAPDQLSQAWPQQFDAVLVDAPCSGEGMFRKDPDAMTEWRPDLAQMCAARQREILTHAVRLVRPGGRLVYSTCTLNAIENEQVLAWAASHLSVEIETLPMWHGWDEAIADAGSGFASITRARRLWPHRGAGEGHFVALLRVGGDSERTTANHAESGKRVQHHKSSHEADLARNLVAWLPEDVIEADWMHPVVHGEGLFVATVSNLNLKGIRVIRNGLCVAVRDHQAWKPHHQFGMALRPGIAVRERAVTRGRSGSLCCRRISNERRTTRRRLASFERLASWLGKSRAGTHQQRLSERLAQVRLGRQLTLQSCSSSNLSRIG